MGTRRINYRKTPDLKKSDALKSEADERIKVIKDNGHGSLRTNENFFTISDPEVKSCEWAAESWYVLRSLNPFEVRRDIKVPQNIFEFSL